jgi:hypothetical protein
MSRKKLKNESGFNTAGVSFHHFFARNNVRNDVDSTAKAGAFRSVLLPIAVVLGLMVLLFKALYDSAHK